MKQWSKYELELAIKHISNGWKYEEISDELKRTKKSVRVKLNKLGYKLNPKINNQQVVCENCGISFSALITEKRKYCSSACAAIKNNEIYPKRIALNKRKRNNHHKRKKNYCLNCGVITTNKYCSSKCQKEFKKKEIFKLIETNQLPSTGISKNKWVKRYLIEKHGNKCIKCGWNEINPVSGNVPIELEHIDGNSDNNSLDNVKLLCPNHHSLTPTYKALNKGNGRHSRMKRYHEGKSY